MLLLMTICSMFNITGDEDIAGGTNNCSCAGRG